MLSRKRIFYVKELHMHIKLIDQEDASRLLEFYANNREHLDVWEPQRSEDFYTIDYWQQLIQGRMKDMDEGRARFFIAVNDDGDVMAYCNLTNIMRGVFQACFMGYAVAKIYEGQGLMRRLCEHVIQHAFADLQLNRIMANYQPQNERSGKLLASLGFEQEGYAKRYLNINGEWRDHVLTALVSPQRG